MNKDLERMLEEASLEPPPDFTARVMQQLAYRSLPARRRTAWERLQDIALIGGAVLGAAQLIAFISGIWIAASVG